MRMAVHRIQAIPVVLLCALSAWHIYSFLSTDAMGNMFQHIGVLALSFITALLSLFYRDTVKDTSRYLENIIHPARPMLLGIACFVLGGLHFITIREEPVFLKIGFMVLLLAFFEVGGMANRFLPALSGDVPEVTRNTIKRLLASQLGILALVFVLSVVLLYLSLMVVLGFTDTLSVAVMAAVMILAVAMMGMIRNL